MKVLVTGAAGFIGGHLYRTLREHGHQVARCDKRWGSSTAEPWWADRPLNGVDVIVHLGGNCSTAASIRDPHGDFVDNAVGTFNVVEAARRAGGIPVLYTSTVKIKPGFDAKVAPLGQSKRVGEQYLKRYREWYGQPYIINRPSTIYGPGQDANADFGWFTWFAKAAVTGQTIRLAGDGTQSRDVLYIDDFVTLLVDQVENFSAYDNSGGASAMAPIYEVGGGHAREVSLNQLLAELGHADVETVERVPGDLQRVVCNNDRVSGIRGWTPTVGWRDGLARTLEWLREQP